MSEISHEKQIAAGPSRLLRVSAKKKELPVGGFIAHLPSQMQKVAYNDNLIKWIRSVRPGLCPGLKTSADPVINVIHNGEPRPDMAREMLAGTEASTVECLGKMQKAAAYEPLWMRKRTQAVKPVPAFTPAPAPKIAPAPIAQPTPVPAATPADPYARVPRIQFSPETVRFFENNKIQQAARAAGVNWSDKGVSANGWETPNDAQKAVFQQIRAYYDQHGMPKAAYEIPQRYLDMYDTFDKGHGPQHREAVRNFAEELAVKHAPTQRELASAAAQLHDIGISVEREGHALHGKKLIEADPEFQQQFQKKDLRTLLEAIANHGSSGNPKSPVARIVSDADKVAEAGPGHLHRAYEWGKVYEPNLTDDENVVRSLKHIQEKFGPGGAGRRLFYPESEERFTREMGPIFALKDDDIPGIRAVIEAEREKSLQKSAASEDFACLMLHPNAKDTASLQKFFKSFVSAEDVYDNEKHEYGVEDQPHITILFGLHSDSAEKALRHFRGQSPVFCFIKGVSIFEPDGKPYDVVKFDITGGRMQQLHKTITDAEPHTKTFADYHPHLTIAYVKRGTGKKYLGKKTAWDGKRLMGTRMRFSTADCSEKTWMALLGHEKTASDPAEIQADGLPSKGTDKTELPDALPVPPAQKKKTLVVPTNKTETNLLQENRSVEELATG